MNWGVTKEAMETALRDAESRMRDAQAEAQWALQFATKALYEGKLMFENLTETQKRSTELIQSNRRILHEDTVLEILRDVSPYMVVLTPRERENVMNLIISVLKRREVGP